MWICTNRGFISIVADRDDPAFLLVRARKRSHLKALFPEARIKTTKKADYRFRAQVMRREAGHVIANAIRSIDYDNFKSSVKDRELHDLYLNLWFELRDYQEGIGRYGRRDALPSLQYSGLCD